MKRLLLVALAAAACTTRTEIVSAVNFVQGPFDPACALSALAEEGGLSLVEERRGRGRTRAVYGFADEEKLLLNILHQDDQPTNLYLSSKVDPARPLRAHAVKLAVFAAEEMIYEKCTEDGRLYGPSVTIQAHKE